MGQDLSIIFCVPSVNQASGLLPFMCDISVLSGGNSGLHIIYTGVQPLCLSRTEERVELPDLSISGLTISNKTALGHVPAAVT